MNVIKIFVLYELLEGKIVVVVIVGHKTLATKRIAT